MKSGKENVRVECECTQGIVEDFSRFGADGVQRLSCMTKDSTISPENQSISFNRCIIHTNTST